MQIIDQPVSHCQSCSRPADQALCPTRGKADIFVTYVLLKFSFLQVLPALIDADPQNEPSLMKTPMKTPMKTLICAGDAECHTKLMSAQ